MASSYFCPEEPRPLAVISESYRDEVKVQLPEFPPWERYSLGDEYESKIFALLDQYLELNTTDTLCYVGDTRDYFVYRLEEHFCLLNPVQTVLPGRFHYEETQDHKVVPIHIAHVGAEEFFNQLVRRADRGEKPVKFDKILVHEGCRYLSEPSTFYANAMRCLTPGGILLLLHRPGRLSTLPVFKEAHSRLADNDVPYMSIIQDLYTIPQLDVHWELESVPVTIKKRKWLAMVRDRYPPHMQVMSHTEVMGGLRELSEGVLKYEGDQVEFDDRLLFVRVTRSKKDKRRAKDPRDQSSLQHPPSPPPALMPGRQDLKLSMALPPDSKPTGPPPPSRSAHSAFRFLWD